LTVSEAISLRRPVLGYAHGGVAEQLELLLPEGQVRVGDLDELASKTRKWLEAPPEIVASRIFDMEESMKATLAVYTELAEAD
jgi:hypothetical protein